VDAISIARFPVRRSAIALFAAALTSVAISGCDLVSHSQNVTGVGCYEQGNYAGAIEQFQLAIQSDPGDADSYYNLGATYYRIGQQTHNATYTQQAEQYYRLALDMDPNHADCYRGLAVLMVEQNRPTDAFALLQNWTARNPASPDARIELARLYQEFGKPDIAQTHLQEALAIDPANPRALSAMGKLKEDSGDRVQALDMYQRSLAYNEYQPDVASRVAALQGAGVGIAAPVVVASPTLPPPMPQSVPQTVPQMAATPAALPMR
jgi:tetratricopeptide (TPR) repeat protein